MKKLVDLVKPFLSLVFGILLFLFYLNYLRSGAPGAQIALGIIGVIIASYFLMIGIMGVLWPKMPSGAKKVFDIISIASFAGFMFVVFLLELINYASQMGAASWIIYILAMVASLGLCVVYIVSRFVKGDAMAKVASIFGLVFVLALVSSLLFPAYGQGASITLGAVPIVPVIIYVIYCSILFKSLGKE